MEIGIWRCLFLWRLKTGEPEEKPLEQGENKQHTQPTYVTGPESNPQCHIGGRRALSPLERQQVDRPYVAKTAAKKPEILGNFLSFVLLCYLSDGDLELDRRLRDR